MRSSAPTRRAASLFSASSRVLVARAALTRPFSATAADSAASSAVYLACSAAISDVKEACAALASVSTCDILAAVSCTVADASDSRSASTAACSRCVSTCCTLCVDRSSSVSRDASVSAVCSAGTAASRSSAAASDCESLAISSAWRSNSSCSTSSAAVRLTLDVSTALCRDGTRTCGRAQRWSAHRNAHW